MMVPYLYIFGREIPTYGIMVALGLLASVLYVHLTLKKRDFPEADGELALIYGGIGAVIGAKLLWLLTVLPEFFRDLPYLFKMPGAFLRTYLTGGFVFYGGLFGGLLAAWIYCRVNKLSYWGLARCLMPVISLFHGFGRLGCFGIGCCYGIPVKTWGITFANSPVAPNGVPLLPVQLFEAAAEFVLFGILAWMARKKDSGRNQFCLWMGVYGVLRFTLEFFRGDGYRGFIGVLSLSQVLSIVAVGLSAWAFFTRKKN